MATLAQEVDLLRRRLDALEGRAMVQKRMGLQLAQVQKFVSGGKRIISGIATARSIDRHGDVVEPTGGRWQLPLPLLWAHDAKSPIGWVREATATGDGIRIKAEIAAGITKADEVWQLVDVGLADGFSIGFLGIKSEPIATGTRWVSWEWLECSVVTIPSNRDSKIGKAKGGIPLIDMRGAVRLIGRNT